MKYKVYTSGNYLTIETVPNEGDAPRKFTALSKDIYVAQHTLSVGEAFSFHKVKGVHESPILLSALQDEAGTAYTLEDFKTFYQGATGSGNSIDDKTQAEYDALTEEEKNNGTTYYIV